MYEISQYYCSGRKYKRSFLTTDHNMAVLVEGWGGGGERELILPNFLPVLKHGFKIQA